MINLIEKRFFTDISEFEFRLQGEKKHIGTGSFGVVKQALHKGTNRMYALKIMDLKELKSEVEWKIIEREIQIHSVLDHPHIAKLWNTLVHEDKVYMIMEYAENGNLFYYQNSKIRFSEAEAFKFFFQTAKAIDYMHSLDVIHRDIKPENLLLDDAFNIKLCDFGWSAYDIQSKRSTFCGTYEYMAPEMVIDQEYDYRIDIWGLGILLYELLHGKAPFRGDSAEDIRAQMRSGFDVKETLSQEVKGLIRELLQINPENRISLKEIFSHQWVRKMTELINNSLRKDQINHPTVIHSKISEIPSSAPIKKRHQKTQSASNILAPKQKNININFLINNFSMKRTFDSQIGPAPQTDDVKCTHKPTKSYLRYKTLTEQSEIVKENGSGSRYKKVKARMKMRPSQDFDEEAEFNRLIRRKSQENVKMTTVKSDPALRVVTQMVEKKQPSAKKKKNPVEDLAKKKFLSTVNLKRLNARPC